MLDPDAILADLGTAQIPGVVRCYDQVASTQDLARQALSDLPDAQAILVVAEEQTAGRGRLGRTWVAPPGSALLCSLALRPTWLAPSNGVALVWLIAVALCEAVESLTPLRPGLKWPNDLLLPEPGSSGDDALPRGATFVSHDPPRSAFAAGDPLPAHATQAWAKAAGILLEVGLGPERIEWAILGFGVNLNAAPPPTLTRYPATSLAAAGAELTRMNLVRTVLRYTDAWYTRLAHGEDDALFEAWQRRLITLGQTVQISMPEGVLNGQAEAVSRSGALLVRDATGTLHTITAGDVGLI